MWENVPPFLFYPWKQKTISVILKAGLFKGCKTMFWISEIICLVFDDFIQLIAEFIQQCLSIGSLPKSLLK